MGVGVNFVTDLGFAERAARYSCFGAARNYGQFGELSSVQSLKENDMTKTKTVIMGRPDWDLGLNVNNSFKSGNALDDSPPWDRTMIPSCEVRKRKSTVSLSSSSSKGSRGGGNPRKASADEKSNSKRCKSWSAAEAEEDDIKDTMEAPKVDQNNSAAAEKENGKDRESNAKPPEPPEPPKQDYIHVRARRGQATDSHSLAERVRRERISERMKFLQDLVPGCNKVTGKAVMLDEIINYVQSLQRQVEFLSMKLATVNPRMDEYDFSYTSQQQGQGGPPLRSLMASNAHETQLDVSWLNRHLSMQLPSLDGFTDSTGAFWEDDLHSVVQMGFVQNHEATVSSHNLHGPTSHMKIEL